MRKHRSMRRRRSRRPDEQAGSAVAARMGPKTAGPGVQTELLGPHYNAGPVHELSAPSPQHPPQKAPVAPVSEERARMGPKPVGPGVQPERLGPHYNAGPVHELSVQSPEQPAREEPVAPVSEEREEQAFSNVIEAEQEQESGAQPAAGPAQEVLPVLEGQGVPTHVVDFNRRGPLRLRGRTDADFDGGSFRTENTTVEAGQGCAGCQPRQCVHATGTLVATYLVQTRVTLPRVSDFPGLTPCQRLRVQNAIDNVLAPHEQQHVAAFEAYNGTTRRAFDLNICRSQFDSTIRRMFMAEEHARRSAAQAASDALDPFHFDVDLDCEEPRASREGAAEPGAAAETPPAEPVEEEIPA